MASNCPVKRKQIAKKAGKKSPWSKFDPDGGMFASKKRREEIKRLKEEKSE